MYKSTHTVSVVRLATHFGQGRSLVRYTGRAHCEYRVCQLPGQNGCLIRHVENVAGRCHHSILLPPLNWNCVPLRGMTLAFNGSRLFQLSYNMGCDAGYLPKVPHSTLFLYCASTATLFHAAILEPTNLRSSYWKFLHSLSGGR